MRCQHLLLAWSGLITAFMYPQTVKTHIIICALMIYEVGQEGDITAQWGAPAGACTPHTFHQWLQCPLKAYTHGKWLPVFLWGFVKALVLYCFNICLSVDKNLSAVFHPKRNQWNKEHLGMIFRKLIGGLISWSNLTSPENTSKSPRLIKCKPGKIGGPEITGPQFMNFTWY